MCSSEWFHAELFVSNDFNMFIKDWGGGGVLSLQEKVIIFICYSYLSVISSSVNSKRIFLIPSHHYYYYLKVFAIASQHLFFH